MRDMRINRIFEGSTEIMHLLIAREAVDQHLAVAGDILEPGRRAQGQGQGGRGGRRVLRQVAAPAGGRQGPDARSRYDEFGDLAKHLRFAERSSRKLARSTFYGMTAGRPRWRSRQALPRPHRGHRRRAVRHLLGVRLREDDRPRSSPSAAEQARELADLFCTPGAAARRTSCSATCGRTTTTENHEAALKVLDGRYTWHRGGHPRPVRRRPDDRRARGGRGRTRSLRAWTGCRSGRARSRRPTSTGQVTPPAYPPLADREALLAELERLIGAAWASFDRPRPEEPGLGRELEQRLAQPLPEHGSDAARRAGRRGPGAGREQLARAAAVPGLRGLDRPGGRRAGRRAGRHLRREPGRHRPRRRPRGGPGAAWVAAAGRLPAVRGRVHQRRHDVEHDRAARGPRARPARLAHRRLRRHQGGRVLLRRGPPLGGARGRGGRDRRAGRAQAADRRPPARAPGRRGRGHRRRPRRRASPRWPWWPTAAPP